METRFFATGNYRQGDRCETAHAMKDGAKWAIYKAAAEMVKYIPTNAVLIPMPSHTGRASYTLELCKRIARETAAEVCDYLKGTPRETLYRLKKQGRKPDGSRSRNKEAFIFRSLSQAESASSSSITWWPRERPPPPQSAPSVAVSCLPTQPRPTANPEKTL